MKGIHIFIEDKEFEAVSKLKDGLTWHDFFMLLACKEAVELAKKIKK